MRKEKDLMSDVHTRALRAADRVGSNGKMHDALLPPPPQRWWQKYFTWERLILGNKIIEKGWVVPQQLGIALIIIVLSGVGAMYWRMDAKIDAANQAKSDIEQKNHDLLIRLDQRLIDKNERDKEKFEQMEKRFQNTDAVQIVLGRDIAKLQAKR